MSVRFSQAKGKVTRVGKETLKGRAWSYQHTRYVSLVSTEEMCEFGELMLWSERY